MPGYNRRRYRSRRRRGNRIKFIAWKKPTAYTQKKQIMSLQKQVNSVTRKLAPLWQYTKFDMPIAVTNLLPPITRTQESEDSFYIFHLLQPNVWEEIFSSNDTSTAPKRAVLKHCRIDAYFTPKNSTTALTQKWVNVWLVSLKKENAAHILNNTNNLDTTAADEGLNATAQGEYYHTRNSSGPFSSMPLLNPKVFKIHQHRSFRMQNIMQEEEQGGVTEEDVDIVDPDKSMKRVLMNQRLNTTLVTASGAKSDEATWKEMTEQNTEQTDRLYIVTHVGGYAEDGDNGVNMAVHVTFTVKTPL